ncbi:hypothetical protein DAI22_02g114000 [Oryza sativa Japonica Group]|nr:hypothetical protein DAI22_02g114000 [Oryza sativa Japonica Group]
MCPSLAEQRVWLYRHEENSVNVSIQNQRETLSPGVPDAACMLLYLSLHNHMPLLCSMTQMLHQKQARILALHEQHNAV